MENDRRLGREDWMRAARLALLHTGPDSVRVEKLARTLNVTKGSFYWHFKDRNEILEALLREWEEETATLTRDALAHPDPREGLRHLLEIIKTTVVLSERGEAPSDAAMFAWASMSADVARRVNQVERQRLQFFTQLTGKPDRAELAYYAYLGFITRRRRVPAAAAGFPLLAEMLFDLLAGSSSARFLARSKSKSISKAKAKSKRRHEKTSLSSSVR